MSSYDSGGVEFITEYLVEHIISEFYRILAPGNRFPLDVSMNYINVAIVERDILTKELI